MAGPPPSARKRQKTEVQPPSSSQLSTQKTRSGFTIYIDDDDTPPPETGLGAPKGGNGAMEVKKEKEVIYVASSSDYGGESDNEDLIAASQEVERMHSSQVTPRAKTSERVIDLASSSNYGGSSDNEDFIAASQELERKHATQVAGQKKVVDITSSSNYGGSSDMEDFIAASQEAELKYSSQVTPRAKVSESAIDIASSSNYGGPGVNGDMVAAKEQMELMRSWVDAGIQMAIDEAATEARVRLLGSGKEDDGSSGAFGQNSHSVLGERISYPHTPVSKAYQPVLQHATPACSQNRPLQYSTPPQYQPHMTLQGHQNTPAASMPPQIQEYYTPQHAAYTSQLPPQYMQPQPSKRYYATPPTCQPPFLQSGVFGSSAPPQTSPTPGPYGMSAFHSGKIPQSSGFISTARQPLTPASNNAEIPPKSITKTQATGQPFILPANQYLSWHELEHHYGPPRANYLTETSHAVVRLAWLKKLKMNIPPFDRLWVAEYKKQEVEDTWAGLPASKRQIVEISALVYKYKTKVSVPCREVPADALPLPFNLLVDRYFKIPERRISGFSDAKHKGALWLNALGLTERIYREHSGKDEESAAIAAYSKLPVVRRRAIEAKAKYLKVQLNPPKPSFKVFEEQYSIRKRDDCPTRKDHERSRETWLRGIGLWQAPFSAYPYTTTELEITFQETTEVAWDELGKEKRADIERKAVIYLKSRTWGDLWGNIETQFGFTAMDGERYTQWLSSIGMGRVLRAGETRDAMWMAKSDKDRAAIWKLAVRMKKEIQERWDAKERAMKRGRRAKNKTRPTTLGRQLAKTKEEPKKRSSASVWREVGRWEF